MDMTSKGFVSWAKAGRAEEMEEEARKLADGRGFFSE